MPPPRITGCDNMGVNYTRRLERAKENFLQSDVNDENKENIIEFIDSLAANDLSIRRQLKYFYSIKTLEKKIPQTFSKATKKDIRSVVTWINTTYESFWTKRDFKIILRIFYRWLREEEGQQFSRYEYPEEVKWINTGKKRHQRKFPKELLTPEDAKNLAQQTNNLRDRALIVLLYESGARIGELLDIKILDIENDNYGCLINISGKTGPRKIRVIASAPAINNWLLEHPDREDKHAYLFCGIWGKKRGKDIGYNTVYKSLKNAAEKAGINKPVNPHHFRHSRATELANKFTEAQLCEYFGWVQGSKEASTYVHLCGRDIDSAVLKLHGIVNEEDEQNNKFSPIECPRCKTKNDPSAKFCSQCSLGLDLSAVEHFEKQKDDLVSNFLKFVKNKEVALETLDSLLKIIQNQ